MSKKLFIEKFLSDNKQTWAILPSSKFLAKKIINKQDLLSSNIIIELWAWSWVFTKRIFELLGKEITNKQILIIEKDPDFYQLLIKKMPTYSKYIYNIDLLDINELLEEKWIKNVDLIISWLPFKSLPKELFDFLIFEFLTKHINKGSKFIQFSYFSNFWDSLATFFKNIKVEKCLLNIPSAYIFTCTNFIKINEKK